VSRNSAAWGAALGLFAAALASAQAPAGQNALEDFARYELRDVATQKKVHADVLARIQSGLKGNLDGPIAQWNHAGTQPGHAGTLVIETVITELRFVSANKRFWGAGYSGESHVGARVRLVEAESGRALYSQNF